MRQPRFVHTAERALAFGVGFAAAACAAYAGATWLRYGHVDREEEEDRDPLTDRVKADAERRVRKGLRAADRFDLVSSGDPRLDVMSNPSLD